MNINEFDKIKDDPEIRQRVARKTFYEVGRSQDPHFSAIWAEVPDEAKEAAADLGMEIIYALVDDHTTPGCGCDFCTYDPESEEPRLLMCAQRWEKLPHVVRSEIVESVYG